MNSILKQIKSSIYSPEFYQDILSFKFSYSLKYFLILVVLISVISTIIFAYGLVPKIYSFFETFRANILKYYPSELIMYFENGKLRVNVPTPYFLPWPKEVELAPPDIENFFVIDIENQFSLEKFKEYKTAILFTQKNLAYLKDGRIVIDEFNPSLNLVIDHKLVSSLANKIDVLKNFIVPIAIFGLFFVFFILNLFKLIYLFLAALIIMLVLRILKIKLEYSKCYQIGLHAMTLPILIFAAFQVFNFDFKPPFLFTAILLIIVIVNFKNNIFNSQQTKIVDQDNVLK